MEVDQKNMSLADIIKSDKAAGRGGKGGADRGANKRGGRGGRKFSGDRPPKQAAG